ncbi:MAG: hypothetical protein ACK5P0_01770 [bacterium]|jgi:hypothetical protein
MATKKKTNKKPEINYKKVYQTFSMNVDNVLYLLHDLKDEAFQGTISNRELIEQLFAINQKLISAFEIAENTVDPYGDDDLFEDSI